jgi:tyrosyl-tRNA synthetase
VSSADLQGIKASLDRRATNPRDLKRRLARELVTLYHDEAAAAAAEEEFDRIFIKRDLPDDVPARTIEADNGKIDILSLLTESKLAESRSDARRLIAGGGVSVNGNRIEHDKEVVDLTDSIILKVGKRKFLKISKA